VAPGPSGYQITTVLRTRSRGKLSGVSETIIVVPCYNEAKRLGVGEFRLYLEKHPAVGFVLVDDGSTDQTLEVLASVRQGFEDSVVVLRSPRNQGKAEAVRYGMNHALGLGSTFVGFWDADLATPLEAIADFVELFRRRPDLDMVFGARVKLLGRYVERRTMRHYLGRVFATAVSVVLNLAIYDTQCGAKLFRVSGELGQVLGSPFLTKWVFDVEILARFLRLRRDGGRPLDECIYELPLQRWCDIEGSKVRPKDFFIAFRDVVRIYLRYLRA
jgi:dolichyl-phosphate beta-glucosyltransferase